MPRTYSAERNFFKSGGLLSMLNNADNTKLLETHENNVINESGVEVISNDSEKRVSTIELYSRYIYPVVTLNSIFKGLSINDYPESYSSKNAMTLLNEFDMCIRYFIVYKSHMRKYGKSVMWINLNSDNVGMGDSNEINLNDINGIYRYILSELFKSDANSVVTINDLLKSEYLCFMLFEYLRRP